MVKKDKNNSLGRSLIKNRFTGHYGKKIGNNSMLHTTEIQDGYDWGRLNLKSITEESSFQEFLSTAELAGTEFQAEKLNIKFVNSSKTIGLLTKEEKQKFHEEFIKNKDFVKIPRRPSWNIGITAEELHEKEKSSFLEWRKSLSILEEEKGLLLTPFEKNIEFWRQLWRVIEMSDVIIQIVDARNPLLFCCEDLEKYVNEVSKNKVNLILLNKADYLTNKQRQYWYSYFKNINRRIVFFSATLASESTLENNHNSYIDNFNLNDIKEKVEELDLSVNKIGDSLLRVLNEVNKLINIKLPNGEFKEMECTFHNKNTIDNDVENSSKILSREELIFYLKHVHAGTKVTQGITTVGLVGYPNVGKSSTINTLMTMKKVSVSATPGKTKHFQTLHLDKDLLLCDCPGLVMPSFIYTKAEMIVNGILPVDQMRDHISPINLISNLIPRHIIEAKYGIILPKPIEGEDENRNPTAEEILNAYAFNRGFMTANGQPDNSRGARYILKDFINGRLLFAHPPPGVKDDEFHMWPPKTSLSDSKALCAKNPYRVTSEELDKKFFQSPRQEVHVKGEKLGLFSSGHSRDINDKPWKKLNKHVNKNKKEKLRRKYAHLDQH